MDGSRVESCYVETFTMRKTSLWEKMLLKAVTQAAERAGIELDLPRLPKRQGYNKGGMTLDDVLKLFTVVDERKLVGRLPCYVAADVSRVPQVNAESVNVLHMTKKIEFLEQHFSGLDTKVDNMCKLACTQTECEIPPSAVHQPSDGSAEDVGQTDDPERGPPWIEVVRRHRPAKPPPPQPAYVQNSQAKVQQNRRKLVGTARTDEHDKLKSGVSIIKKAVFHIDNLDPNCTQALLTDYLLAADIILAA